MLIRAAIKVNVSKRACLCGCYRSSYIIRISCECKWSINSYPLVPLLAHCQWSILMRMCKIGRYLIMIMHGNRTPCEYFMGYTSFSYRYVKWVFMSVTPGYPFRLDVYIEILRTPSLFRTIWQSSVLWDSARQTNWFNGIARHVISNRNGGKLPGINFQFHHKVT